MNPSHNLSTFETLEYPPSSGMSELDGLSDSDWLDISSNRESDDNDSVISADSDHKIGSMPLSRRSSMSVGSSREGDVEAWEGFIDDSSDEGERNIEGRAVPAASMTADVEDDPIDPEAALASPAHIEIAEEQRVMEALDQSLVSTLYASRSSVGSTHNSLRDLRLSFPDPLTSSHDELNRSYNTVSPSEIHSIPTDLSEDTTTDDSPDQDGTPVDPLNSEDPGLRAIASEVLDQEINITSADNKAEFEVVLYGSSSSDKWNFVKELVRKIATASGRTLHDAVTSPGSLIQYLHLERKIDDSLSISEFVAVHDRTGDILDSKSLAQAVAGRPSLAIIYLPAPIQSIPEHNKYLPVFAPATSSDELASVARITARHDWENLHIPSAKIAYVNNGIDSPVFDCKNVKQVPEWRANQLLQHLKNAQTKKKPIKYIADHLNSVHAVTLFALMSLIVGFAANTAFRVPSATTPAPASTFWKIFGTEVNRTTVLATTAGVTKPTVTTTVKNVAISILNPAATSLTISSTPASAADSISTIPENLESKPFAWIDRARSGNAVIVRPTSQLSVDSKPPVTMTPHAPSVAGPSKSTSLSLKVVDSLSEALDIRVKALAEDIRNDFDDLMELLDDLSQGFRRQTQSTMEQSKSKASAICESVVHRNDRAREKAKELKKIGEELIVAAGELFRERTDIARKKARSIGFNLVLFETWRDYQRAHGQWVTRLKAHVRDVEHRRRRDRMNRCNRKLIGRKIQRAPRVVGCAF